MSSTTRAEMRVRELVPTPTSQWCASKRAAQDASVRKATSLLITADALDRGYALKPEELSIASFFVVFWKTFD